MRKVPEITLFFWAAKLLTTALGESTSDYLVHTIDPVIAVLVGFVGLAIAIAIQFWMKKYVAWAYWLAVTMVAIFGTMAADVLHIGLGIPYVVSSIVFSLSLAIIFIIWQKGEHSLSIHSITTYRREFFYWTTVMVTFALGTAIGDMTAATFGLGYLLSGILFSILFAIPAIGNWKLGWNSIFSFWMAYIITRPLGASFADWLGRTASLGGIGIGTAHVSIALAIFLVGLVLYLSMSKKDSRFNS